MKTLVLFYSFSGHTEAIAKELAEKESADIAEIIGVRRIGKLKAYTAGIVGAIRGKAWAILPLEVDWDKYERLILLAPVWADNPPPVFNAALGLLPEDKTVAVKMVSASGKSKCKERIESAIIAKSCTLESFEDLKG